MFATRWNTADPAGHTAVRPPNRLKLDVPQKSFRGTLWIVSAWGKKIVTPTLIVPWVISILDSTIGPHNKPQWSWAQHPSQLGNFPERLAHLPVGKWGRPLKFYDKILTINFFHPSARSYKIVIGRQSFRTQLCHISAMLWARANPRPLLPTAMGGSKRKNWSQNCSNVKHKIFRFDR